MKKKVTIGIKKQAQTSRQNSRLICWMRSKYPSRKKYLRSWDFQRNLSPSAMCKSTLSKAIGKLWISSRAKSVYFPIF